MGFGYDHFQIFAAYNAWANEQLYDVCSQLETATYFAPRQAFFGSIHGTLNHILVGDRIWMGRFEDVDHGITALDEKLYDDFDSLRAARVAEDDRIVRYIAKLDDDALAQPLHYRTVAGKPHGDQLALLLAHFFNHQTHHRGQVHDQLTQTGIAPPPLDLLIFLHTV
jgi:uncharacterized damage-inducible protein DinB